MIAQEVPDHHDQFAFVRKRTHAFRVSHVERKRLLDEHVLAGGQRA